MSPRDRTPPGTPREPVPTAVRARAARLLRLGLVVAAVVPACHQGESPAVAPGPAPEATPSADAAATGSGGSTSPIAETAPTRRPNAGTWVEVAPPSRRVEVAPPPPVEVAPVPPPAVEAAPPTPRVEAAPPSRRVEAAPPLPVEVAPPPRRAAPDAGAPSSQTEVGPRSHPVELAAPPRGSNEHRPAPPRNEIGPSSGEVGSSGLRRSYMTEFGPAPTPPSRPAPVTEYKPIPPRR